MHLSGLFLYPVKSLRGCAVTSASVDPLGIVGDRRFMLVDAAGRFLSQRTLPRLALIATALKPDHLILSAAGAGSIGVSRRDDPAAPRRIVSVWKSEGLVAEDCGDGAAAWLGEFLGATCRLVRIGPEFHRPVRHRPPPSSRGKPAVVAFADAYPFLVVSEASLGELNDRLLAQGDEPVPMDRFRPNLVIAGCQPYAEDAWPRLRVGVITFQAAGPCARCAITTTDQATAARGDEPLRTLATCRRDPKDPSAVNFGQNLIHEDHDGVLRLGDPVAPA